MQLFLDYAKAGVTLWFFSLLPSLLPFLILSNIMVNSRLFLRLQNLPGRHVRRWLALSPQGIYALMLGMLCGYPMGAKVTADLYGSHDIGHDEAVLLLAIASYPGPMFVMSYVVTGCLRRPELTALSLLILYTSGLLTGVLLRILRLCKTKAAAKNNTRRNAYKKEVQISSSCDMSDAHILEICTVRGQQKIRSNSVIGHSGPKAVHDAVADTTMDQAILDAFEAMARLGGYVILFSILSGFLLSWLAPLGRGKYLVSCCLEMASGIASVTASPLSFSFVYPLAMACLSFGGLCVLAQTKSMLSKSTLSLKSYVTAKICSGGITWMLCRLLIALTVID